MQTASYNEINNEQGSKMLNKANVNFEYNYFGKGYFFMTFAFMNSKLNEKPPFRAA